MSAGGSQRRQWMEQVELAGDQLLHRIEVLIREGNVRHIRIKHDGHVVLEVPVTLAVAGGLLAPVQAALAAFAAAVTHCTMEIIREEPGPQGGGTNTPPGAF